MAILRMLGWWTIGVIELSPSLLGLHLDAQRFMSCFR